ncbi:polysaccharide deacetylase family protein [Falsiroseomonas sp. HC035]|uniref:polysaccharide deacetylase family protein n=1 Tax=Falsiroseomonas sp. HC035 TaxID=3390999 RepID=UPI003D30F1E9
MRLPKLGLTARLRAAGHRLGLRRGAVVLMYHRVAAPGSDPWDLCVSPTHFQDHLGALRDWGATILPLAELVAAAEQQRLPKRALAITFDDGYADNYHAAFPLLERSDAPATIFVATGPILASREFWWDALERLLLGGALPARLQAAVGGQARVWMTADPPALYRQVWAALSDLPPNAQQAALGSFAMELGRAVGRPRETHRPLTPAELGEFAGRSRGLIEFGGHTADHPRLPTLPPAGQRDQIQRGKDELEAMIGMRVHSFSYPFGAHDGHGVAAVRDAGFLRACTTSGGGVGHRPDHFRLARLPVPDMPGDALVRQVSAICA